MFYISFGKMIIDIGPTVDKIYLENHITHRYLCLAERMKQTLVCLARPPPLSCHTVHSSPRRGGGDVRTTRMLITYYHITQSTTVYVRLLKAYEFEGKGMSKTV